MRASFPLPDLAWPPTAGFWDAAARRELAIPRCDRCGEWIWYPRTPCPACASPDVTWTATSGRGRVYSWTVVHRMFLAAFAGMVPYVVALIELDEAPRVRIVGRIDAAPDQLRAGLPVAVEFELLRFAGVDGEVVTPFFRALPGE